MKYAIVLLLFTMNSFLSCQNSESNSDKALSLPEKIDLLMETLHFNGQFNGTVLVADSSGVVYEKAWGYADLENQDTLTTETVFYLGSIAKQFTAMSLMILQHEGSITFDESIRTFFPELPTIMDAITLEHMLTHTSGIPDYYNLGKFEPGFTNDDVMEVAKNIDILEFEPGSQYAYSNTSYVLLSMVVEKISGTSWREFLHSNVFDPLDMNYTQVYDETEPSLPHRAKGHTQDGISDEYHAYTTGGGGIFSHVKDLYVWDQALYTDQIIPQGLILQAYQPFELANGDSSYYGWGWMLDEENPNIVRHSGSLAGFRTFIHRDLENRITVILLSNYTNEVAKIKDEILGLMGAS